MNRSRDRPTRCSTGFAERSKQLLIGSGLRKRPWKRRRKVDPLVTRKRQGLTGISGPLVRMPAFPGAFLGQMLRLSTADGQHRPATLGRMALIDPKPVDT